MAIVLDQEWSIGSQDASGTATTSGACIIVAVTTSDETSDVTVSDNGGNTYTLATVTKTVSNWTNLHLFYCLNANATSYVDPTETGSGAMHVGVWSFTGVDSLDVADSEMVEEDDPIVYPLTATEAGSLAFSLVTFGTTNRYIQNDAAGWSAFIERRSSGLATIGSYNLNAGPGSVGPSWSYTSGSTTTPVVGGLVMTPGEGGGPSALEVDAGADQSIYVGQSASVSASASGGTSPYTYAWTVISGSGSFLNANQASTTFTPTGGAGTRTLRCIVTDANSTVAQDDLTVTASQAPEFVTIASVNDSTGWTPTGGTVQQVLSDTSDSTLVTSIENPTAQVLDVVMGPAVVGEGQNWTQRVRMRRSSSASSGTATGYLYTGSTLISTVPGRPIPGSLGDVDFTFPNADVATITTQQWTDGVRFVVEVTAR